MKRTILFALVSLSFITASSQTVSQATAVAPVTESILVKNDVVDFGKIPQGKPVYTWFEIVNISGQPLVIENVSASCGCTTPEWNKEPIAPGATAKIKVGYNAASEGYFEKPVTVTYGGGKSQMLKVKGTVWKGPAGPAPANASVQFLKQQTL